MFSVRDASHNTVVENMSGHVQEGVKEDDAGGNKRKLEDPLDEEQTKAEKEVVHGFNREFHPSIQGLLMLMMKAYVGVEVG